MTVTKLPDAKAVRDLLTDLLGKSVDVILADPLPSDARTAVAIYTTDRLATAAVVAFTAPLAAYLGAALGLLPPAGAKEAAAAGSLPANLEENFSEVVNILASLFNRKGAPHVKLYSVVPPGAPVPADVARLFGGLGARLDLAVAVPAYGDGRVSLVLAT